MDLSRRSLLSAGLVLGATTLTGMSGPLQGARATRALPADPFRLGVASGDPSPSGFVLWTRLALHLLASDRRDQQVFTRASVAIADQEPGVHLTADNPV